MIINYAYAGDDGPMKIVLTIKMTDDQLTLTKSEHFALWTSATRPECYEGHGTPPQEEDLKDLKRILERWMHGDDAKDILYNE